MKRILEPLAQIPGVRMALLVAHDGVPVVVKNAVEAPAEGSLDSTLASETAESLAALAAGWIAELDRSIAPLSWGAPERLVLRAARGSLVMTHAPGTLLVVIVDQRMSPDELRLPMEAAVARMQRLLRQHTEATSTTHPALPARPESKGHASTRADTAP